MSVSQWQPSTSKTISIDASQLTEFIELGALTSFEKITDQLNPETKKNIQVWIKAEQKDWQTVIEDLSDEKLLNLIQFFTLAEQLPNCQAGAESCVIALVKLYKLRGKKLERNFLQWIKANTDNKFLPNGPL